MKATAWYCNYDYWFNFPMHMFKEGKPAPVVLNETHFACPVFFNNPDATSVPDFLEQCFSYFNWVQYDFAAPDSVNEFARAHDSHASLSVGDVVEVEGEFYVCAVMGWEKVDVSAPLPHTD